MGRAAQLPKNTGATQLNTMLCRKIYTNYTHVVARCFDSTGSTAYTDYEMKREMSAAPEWMVAHMKQQRVRCNAQECNAVPPAWKTEFNTQQVNDLPHGPEVSYGIPFRWSASRLLAGDMRSVLCSALSNSSTAGNNGTTAARRVYHNDSASCDALLNVSAWTVSNFIKSYADSTFGDLLKASLKDLLVAGNPDKYPAPPSLLEVHDYMMGRTPSSSSSTSTAFKNIMQRPDEDSLLWSGADAPGWVACSQRNQTCYGKISKQEWYSSSKAGACRRVFGEQVKQGLVNSTAVGVDICNLNSKTNEMCQVGVCFLLCL